MTSSTESGKPGAAKEETPADIPAETPADTNTKPHDAFLKVIIAYKAVWGVSEFVVAFYILTFIGSDPMEEAAKLISLLGLDEGGSLAEYIIDGAASITKGAVIWTFLTFFAMGVINSVEAWGLHIRRRWAEWLAVFATGIFIPYELYVVITDFTLGWAAALIMNSAIVYYLAKHKELFTTKKEAVEYERTHPHHP